MLCFAVRSLPLEYCRKTTLASGLVFFAFFTAAFTACGTPSPAVERQQLPQAPFIEMISIPGGTFRMGSTRETGLLNETPAHQVTLHAFLLSQYEVTQGQYFEITGMRPSSCKTNPESRTI